MYVRAVVRRAKLPTIHISRVRLQMSHLKTKKKTKLARKHAKRTDETKSKFPKPHIFPYLLFFLQNTHIYRAHTLTTKMKFICILFVLKMSLNIHFYFSEFLFAFGRRVDEKHKKKRRTRLVSSECIGSWTNCLKC